MYARKTNASGIVKCIFSPVCICQEYQYNHIRKKSSPTHSGFAMHSERIFFIHFLFDRNHPDRHEAENNDHLCGLDLRRLPVQNEPGNETEDQHQKQIEQAVYCHSLPY